MYCGAFTPESLEATGKVPAGYTRMPNGSDRVPGAYGEGFGGEALIILLPNDDGQWFRDLCAEKDLEWEVHTA